MGKWAKNKSENSESAKRVSSAIKNINNNKKGVSGAGGRESWSKLTTPLVVCLYTDDELKTKGKRK